MTSVVESGPISSPPAGRPFEAETTRPSQNGAPIDYFRAASTWALIQG
jgi:hypothetical protein